MPPIATTWRRSPIAAIGLVALITLATLAGPTLVNAADAAKTTSKTKPPVILPPLPPIPVKVVEGDVKVTGVVEISNTANTAIPVIVQNAPSMQGMVEVLNDVLYQPFVVTQSGFLAGGGPSHGAVAHFDIPEGKRLIVETVSVQMTTERGQTAAIDLLLEETEGSYQSLPFGPTQWQLVDPFKPFDVHVGCHAFKMRKDAVPGSDDEIVVSLYRSNATGTFSLQVGICGYLVDL